MSCRWRRSRPSSTGSRSCIRWSSSSTARYWRSSLDLLSCGPLTFDPIDEAAFPCFALAKEAAKTGGTACTAMNAANEEAVALYLQDRIGFYDIPDAVAAALRLPVTAEPSLDDIFEADRLVRAYTRERFSDR